MILKSISWKNSVFKIIVDSWCDYHMTFTCDIKRTVVKFEYNATYKKKKKNHISTKFGIDFRFLKYLNSGMYLTK